MSQTLRTAPTGAGYSAPPSSAIARIVTGFIAGALAFLVFHQGAVYLADLLGLLSIPAYSVTPAAVTGVPQLVSTAFWAGVWGIVFAFVQTGFPRGAAYWLWSFLFGAIFPSLIAFTLVPWLKDLPLLADGNITRLVAGTLLNGIWGFGAALIYRALIRR
ncbi:MULTISPECIES: hypothetical protein [Rhodomicrobium]|uniref:hypothetical protein n=1 Tax=Rhodomicrobium TaxID=1068 RepID=UPI000B4A6108|nr:MULTISPECIES: hypothetical protein [Rhodomicrobium]